MPADPAFLPLWPRPGVTETLEWLTSVIEFENGEEDRTEMRSGPRQSFQMEFYVPPAFQPRVNNIIYGGRTLRWYLPLWPQVQRLGAVDAGETSLTAETRYSEFDAGGFALLYQSPAQYQIVGVDSVAGADTLTLSEETEAFLDAWLVPVRIARLTGTPTRSLDGKKSVLTCEFMIDNCPELTVAAPDQFLGSDAYFDPGLLDGSTIPEQISARVDTFDEELGLISYRSPWIFNKPTRTHRMMGEDHAETWAIREWLHRRRGRSVAFWQPSFENDLRVNDTGAITGALSVYPDQYLDYASPRAHVAIETADGEWLPRTITGAVLLGPDEMQITFNTSLGGIDASTIKRISYMGLKRLDADRAEVRWIGGTVAACSVSVREIEP